ncbi:hypothetical protein E1091_02355 [Micromonospora fluostatini]|uniref:Uncharacterized protein n=1 Tax=Micromonospora fluostatini TaxID=1629071 RepID=A0ABY2DL03_9ACTN|nr:hypothetical protein E1091_02355 [Micromonospora fluostatini]
MTHTQSADEIRALARAHPQILADPSPTMAALVADPRVEFRALADWPSEAAEAAPAEVTAA